MKSKICIFITLFLFLTLGINVHSTETNNSLKRVPAEWEPQEAIWIQWPGHWEKAYEPTFAKMSEIISRYEKLHILYGTEKIYDDARKAISDIGADPNNNINWHSASANLIDMDSNINYVLIGDMSKSRKLIKELNALGWKKIYQKKNEKFLTEVTVMFRK